MKIPTKRPIKKEFYNPKIGEWWVIIHHNHITGHMMGYESIDITDVPHFTEHFHLIRPIEGFFDAQEIVSQVQELIQIDLEIHQVQDLYNLVYRVQWVALNYAGNGSRSSYKKIEATQVWMAKHSELFPGMYLDRGEAEVELKRLKAEQVRWHQERMMELASLGFN